MTRLDRLWAGWRHEYIARAVGSDADTVQDTDPDGSLETTTAGTLFQRLAALPDDEGHIVARGAHCFAILNAYPYTSGHLMVVPNRPATSLGALRTDEHAALWEMVRAATATVERAYAPQGMNVGLNLGAAGGAGVPDHLHVHVVPRWSGDTNFMTAVAEARVLPEPLPVTWERLRSAWPA